jgi:hypothetical protein
MNANPNEPVIEVGPEPAKKPVVMPMPKGISVPSLIPIPHQLAVTACWVGVGVALGYYLCYRASRPSRRGIN